jgi:hypothetical protein
MCSIELVVSTMNGLFSTIGWEWKGILVLPTFLFNVGGR